MFTKSLDNKITYTNSDGIEMIDIMDTIYMGMYDEKTIHSVYKANKQCEMRPDYLSACLYGDEAYAEIAIKTAMLSNPFALEAGDIVYAMTLDNIYNNVKEVVIDSKNGGPSMYELVKRYHKYIDKDKVPKAAGSEENKIKITPDKLALEPNISKTGSTGITIKNGKIYFGKNKSEIDAISEVRPDVNNGVPVINTGSFNVPDTDEYNNEDEDYIIAGTIGVNEENSSLIFDLDDDVEEDFTKFSAEAVNQKNNNITLNGTKIFFTGDSGQEAEDKESEIESDLIIPTDSDMVDCAKSGISLGRFLSASVSSCK